jgi:hypothetical protein
VRFVCVFVQFVFDSAMGAGSADWVSVDMEVQVRPDCDDIQMRNKYGYDL